MDQAPTITADEITEATAIIRMDWSQEEAVRRLERGTDAMVELLAGIMKPMAVEAGLTDHHADD